MENTQNKTTYHLIVSATQGEVNHFLSESKAKSIEKNVYQINPDLFVLITGIGTHNTILSIQRFLFRHGKPKSIVNIGICGAYNKNLELCQVVQIDKDIFADRIIENQDQTKFWSGNSFESDKFETFSPHSPVICNHLNINIVTGITSDKVAGTIETIQFRKYVFKPDVETMEGAAVFYIAQHYNIQACQLRSVSNYVEPRNKINWQITNAISHLNSFVIENILDNLRQA